MPSATIKLFLPYGDGKRLRTAEISNWSGKALAAPRTDLDELLTRDELQQSGVYILVGTEPESGKPMAYIGEAEVLADRIKAHKSREFWVSLVLFLSKDENLTKSHIRYLEGRLIEEAEKAERFLLDNAQGSGAKLPEADRYDMEEFLTKVVQLLPVLGSDLLIPIGGTEAQIADVPTLRTEIKGLVARGRRTPSGFAVLVGSQAVSALRESAQHHTPSLLALRAELVHNEVLQAKDGHLVFARDYEFSSPSLAAAVIHGGSMNGLTAWRNDQGTPLRELEAD